MTELFSRNTRLECCVSIRNEIIDYLCAARLRDTEERSLAVMACRRRDHHFEALVHSQRASGAWSFGEGDGPGNCFHTALALMAIRAVADSGSMPASAKRAFEWLDGVSGREGHWLWKWKFRLFDRRVRFDTNKTGWPWVEGTVSWVAPTAMVLLAHRAWNLESPRLEPAEAMLLDRACAAGGWNAGNPEVFGVALDPHPDFTAMTLLALGRPSPHVDRSLNYLERRSTGAISLYSLAWATLALTRWKHPGRVSALSRIGTLATDVELHAPRSLALAALALEGGWR